ncbi:MAG: Capreomycidine synthase [Promethearchaeota archaeon]|nr:MAG: Capreomycidine synthase [Candidatus Lokiarchaeota archaeon]
MRIDQFKLEEFFAKYEFKVEYLLCSSDCESWTIEELLDLGPYYKEELNNLWLGYTESEGDLQLRKEISKIYTTIDEDNILVFSGAEEGIFIFMNVFLNKGDHIIVQYPAYQSLFEIANSIGCEVSYWNMVVDKDWDLKIEDLRASIRSNTKAIILNFPHNPTGFIPDKEKYRKIVDLAEEHDIYLFSDEVYRYLEYKKKDRLPAACDIYENALSLGVMSKTFGLAGLRIGWIASDDIELLDKLQSFKHYTTICNSAPSEYLATIALENKNYLIERNLEIIGTNLELLDEFFEVYDEFFDWYRPKAGSIAFPKLKIDQNIEEFCLDLLDKEGVLLMPSTKYNYGKKHFRIGFGRINMPEALEKLEKYMKGNF